MAFELHIWGPGFGLPSINAQCLAAILYLQQVVPQGQWTLLPSSNPCLSPIKELPALRHGDTWIGGFRNIIRYLDDYSNRKWNLDAGLDKQQQADCTAFSAFIASRGLPLLELSFVSPRNYATTISLYSKIEPFPLQYLTASAIREAAKAHAERLGLSGFDIDEVDEESPPEQSIIPPSLRRKRLTVSSLLSSQPETKSRIKLDALATAFLEPLNRLKGRKKYLLSDTHISSLDCEALGYLSLILYPDLPQPWLKNSMQSKFPDLCDWVRGLAIDHLVEPTDGLGEIKDGGLERTARAQYHPWTMPPKRTLFDVGAHFSARLIDSVPLIRLFRRTPYLQSHGGDLLRTGPLASTWRPFFMTLSSILAGVGLLAGYMVHRGKLSLPFYGFQEASPKRLEDYGEAGAALGLYAIQMAAHREKQAALEQPTDPVVQVEVDIEPKSTVPTP